MIILDTTSTILRVKLGAVVTTNQLPVSVWYVDRTTTTFNPASTNTATNGTTYVTITSSPAASTQRQVKFFTIQNQDTVAATLIIEFYDGTNGRQLVKTILQPDETIQYADGEGFKTIDADGNIKVSTLPDAIKWIDYSASSTVTGWSSTTVKVIQYAIVGKIMIVAYSIAGTSNSTAVSFTIPNTMLNATGLSPDIAFRARDNGGTATMVGMADIQPNASTINFYPTGAAGTWTNSGTKQIQGVHTIPIQ